MHTYALASLPPELSLLSPALGDLINYYRSVP